MSNTRNSGPECPISLRPKTTTATKVFIVSALAVIACCLFSMPAYAQGSLPLGTIGVTPPQLCAPGSGFYYYSNGGTNYYSSCQTGTITCSNVASTIANLSLTFGYLNPATIQPPLVPQVKGLIVLHGGSGGTAPESFELADAYFKAGYEVVQLAWTDD